MIAAPWTWNQIVTSLRVWHPKERITRLRNWCEQVWRDFKSQGFDLEATALAAGERLERLLLGMALAMVWVLWLGAAVIRHGFRQRVDSGTHRKLSLFQIGLRWLAHRWAFGAAPSFLKSADQLEVSL
jgi:hypothetical protein